MRKLSVRQIIALHQASMHPEKIITGADARYNTLWSLRHRGLLLYIGDARRYIRDRGVSMPVYQLTLQGFEALEARAKELNFTALNIG
jgi:hypothetical protein